MPKPPEVVTVYAVENGDKSVTIFRDAECQTKLVFYPADCAEKPTRKYTLFVKLPSSARWALKWLN